MGFIPGLFCWKSGVFEDFSLICGETGKTGAENPILHLTKRFDSPKTASLW
jgi:hypothetical protein